MGSIALSCVKNLLFTSNLVCALLGIAIIVFGVLNLTANLENFTEIQYLYIAIIAVLVLGAIIFVIAFLGCCGALLENRFMIFSFAALIIILFITELLGGIAFYSLYNEESLTENLQMSLSYYSADKSIQKFWDIMNYQLQCCGVNSHADWGDNIPNSCCKDIDVNEICHKEQAFEIGCADEMVKFFKQVMPVLLSVVAAVQLLQIIFAFCLGRIKNPES